MVARSFVGSRSRMLDGRHLAAEPVEVARVANLEGATTDVGAVRVEEPVDVPAVDRLARGHGPSGR